MAINIKNVPAAQAGSAVEFVDLSAKPAKAKIVRSGFDVPAVQMDTKKVDQFVGDLTQILPKDLPRVVSQAVPAGTKVVAGTVVDLVLAPRTKIPFNIFTAVHVDLATKNLDQIDSLFANPAAKKTLQTYESADDVPQVEKDALKTAFAAVGVTVDDTNPSKTFEKAFDSARGGMAFQG